MASQPRDNTKAAEGAYPLRPAGDTASNAGFGPTVAPPWHRVEPLPERLLPVREVAARLEVSEATVYKLCARGELAHVRFGNAVRIGRADLAAFIERGRRE